MNDTVINVLIILVPLVVCLGCGVLYGYFIGSKCPACKQFGALVPTGKFEKTTGTGVLGIGIRIMDEYRCKYCGHMEWQERSAGGGG